MSRKLTAVLLIAAAVLANAAFTVLGMVFNYPDVLKEPVEDILAAFTASQTAVTVGFAVLALSAALMAPIAIGVGRLSSHPAMRVAVPVGIAAAIVQVIGLSRWPLLVPGFAADAASADPEVAAGARESFELAHRVMGNLIGETFGYILTAAWTLLVLVALGRTHRRPLVHRPWCRFRRARSGRRTVTPRPAGDRHRELHRIRPLERLGGGLRDPAAPPAAYVRHCRRADALRRRGAVTVMISSTPRRYASLLSWLIWTVGFISFPVAGIAAGAIAGPVSSPLVALVAGLVTGAVIGTGQWLASRRRLRASRWIPSSTVGMGLGLLLGATIVDFGTTLADLALMGGLTGLLLGIAQAIALPPGTRHRWAWAVAMPALWALGWTVSTVVGIAVEEQFSIFGSTGAVTFSALSGILLLVLLPRHVGPAATSAGQTTVDANHQMIKERS